MSKIIESESELDKVLSECSNIFVLFYASWCPYSKQFLPIFEKYSRSNERRFCRVVTDETPGCADDYEIETVPTVIYFENGAASKRLDGIPGEGLDEYQLRDLISSCESVSGKNAKPKRK